MNSNTSVARRKVHARRGTDRACSACNAFVWASDRPQQRGPQTVVPEESQSLVSCIKSIEKDQPAASSDRAECAHDAAHGFRWLTDYIADHELPAANKPSQSLNKQDVSSQPPGLSVEPVQLPHPAHKNPSSWFTSWRTKQHNPPPQQQHVTAHQQPRMSATSLQPPKSARCRSGAKAAAQSVIALVKTAAACLSGGVKTLQHLSHQVADSVKCQGAGQTMGHQSLRQGPRMQAQQAGRQQQHSTMHAAAGVPATAAASSGVMSVFQETSQAVTEIYTDTLKPAAELVWHLLVGIYSLTAALLLYVVLPLLWVCMTVSKKVLLLLNSHLLPSRQLLLQQIVRRPAIAASSADDFTVVDVTPAVHGVAVAEQGMAYEASAAAAPTTAATGMSASSSSTCQQTSHDQQLLHLLQCSQHQLAASCKHLPGCLITPQQLSSSSSGLTTSTVSSGSSGSVGDTLVDSFTWLDDSSKLPINAGHGPCAYKAVLYGIPVAVQLYAIASRDDAVHFCDLLQIVWGLRHPNLMLCLGATVQLVPASCCSLEEDCADAVETAVENSEQSEGHSRPEQQQQQQYVVAGCIVYQLLSQGQSMMAALQSCKMSVQTTTSSVTTSSSSTSSAAAVALSAAAAANGFVSSSSSRPLSAVAATASNVNNVTRQLPLASWKTRLQLTPQIVAAVHNISQTMVDLATYFSNHISSQQLWSAAVLDLSSPSLQLKLNPSLLPLGRNQQQQQQQHQPQPEGCLTGLAVALGDALLQLAVVDVDAGSSSSGSGGVDVGSSFLDDNLHLLRQLARCRLSQEGVDDNDEAAHDIMMRFVSGWHSHFSRQQRQQQQLVQQLESSQSMASSISAPTDVSETSSSWPVGVGSRTQVLTKMVAAPRKLFIPRQHNNSSSSSSRSIYGSQGSSDISSGDEEQTGALPQGISAPLQNSVANIPLAGASSSPDTFLDWESLLKFLQQISEEAAAQQRAEDQRQEALAQAAAAAAARLQILKEPPALFICPITSSVMRDPVVACDGYSYERAAITHWLQVARPARSPMTNQAMQPYLVTNHALRSAIKEWNQQQQYQRQQ